jgi:response regulator RpfG family c-di-GMP phosphodiesterase
MARPTFLVAEPQPSEGISARKLILETARYNVITAYNGPEALEMVDLFPAVDGVIIHAALGDNHIYEQVIEKAAAKNPKQLIILISPTEIGSHASAQYHLSSHDPKQLLDVLLDRFGEPD